MSWRPAPSVKAALDEATRRWPKRKTGIDGMVGDAEHASRQSDHNPDARGIVHAFDITHDPANGVDCETLARHLVSKRDSRVKKIIWNRRTIEPPVWEWRPYTGEKPHTTHMHVSILYTAGAENNTSNWWNFDEVSKATFIQNEVLAAINMGRWKRAFELLNGLSMTHILTVLDGVDVAKLAAQRGAYAGTVNMPRLEFAMHVIEFREVPQVAPGVVPVSQVQEAERYLKGAPKSAAAEQVDVWRGKPWPRGTNRPRPPGYVTLTPVSVKARKKADELLRTSHPIGTHIRLKLDGADLIFAIEWHKHPPEDPVPPALKDWHRGISILVKR